MDRKQPLYGAPPPPPPSSYQVDHRAPPPHHPYVQHPQHQQLHQQPPPPHHPPYNGPAPVPPHSAAGPALPPLQQPYGPPTSASDQPHLPSFRHHSQYSHEGPPREGQDYSAYLQHNRADHATPAPVSRTYSHDFGHQQQTPTTPHPVSYPPASGPDGAQPPAQHHMDHGLPHGYPQVNGVPHGLPPPPGHPQHSPHEQHPQYMTPGMEAHHPYPPPPSQQVYQPNYAPTSNIFNVQRKKQMRATQACEQCRQRKQKCDEGSPCSFCKENNLTCQYRDTPPAKTDKNMERLMSHMETQSAHMESQAAALRALSSKFDVADSRLRRVERSCDRLEPPGQRSALEDHRTAPHKLLLLWPSVNFLLKAAKVNVNEGYVMEAEDRSILRLHTRGEGIDEHDGTQPGGPASPAHSDDSGGDTNTPTRVEGLWGTGLPQMPNGDIRRSEPYNSWGGLKPDNTLDLDAKTVWELFESYIRHIHIMHPFLDKNRLRKLVDNFVTRYSPGNTLRPTTFAVTSTSSDFDGRPMKRQRSNGSPGMTTMGPDGAGSRSQITERSPSNAIVYLVLALGKICLHRDPLPAVVPDSRLNANAVVQHQLGAGSSLTGSSPTSATVKPSSNSPNSTPGATQPTPSYHEGSMPLQSRSRRVSGDGMYYAGARNPDVIPGLAYYAKAAEILGEQVDGNDLVHAQMFLLAGLYKGQLARVKESMSWITIAGRAVQALLDRHKLYGQSYWEASGDIRKKYKAGQDLIKDKRHSLIVFASWTCLQLETDILAELKMPASGIASLEDLLIWPKEVPEEETYEKEESEEKTPDSSDMLLYYSFQLWLRKRLNKIHREIYGPDCLHQTVEQICDMLKEHETILGDWRQSLPPALKWNDADPPAEDILAARLRAKYWGAKYVVNRPFLDYALHILPLTKGGETIRDAAKDVHGGSRNLAEIHLFEAIEAMGEQEVFNASQRCIDAAMQSTIALDGVPGRLVVTNIHGTAHAQFGNMLVCSATYNNNWSKWLVNKTLLQSRLERTITFLRRLCPISPTCKLDCQILEKIHKQLFGIPSEAAHVYANEGVVEAGSATNSFNAST